MSDWVATWLVGVRDRLRRDEAGITMIEVIVAAALAVIIIGGAAGLFAESNDSALGSQRQAQLLAVADQQIEQIREQVKTNASGFAGLAMSSAPLAGTNTTTSYSSTSHIDPNDFVSASTGCGTNNAGYLIEANYNDNTAGVASGVSPWTGCATGAEPLVVAAGGIVTPKQTIALGSGTATVYSYVTDTYVGCTTTGGLGSCTSATGDARRLIVAVVPTSAGRNNLGPNAPAFVSTIFTNPVPTNQVNSSIGLTLGLGIG